MVGTEGLARTGTRQDRVLAVEDMLKGLSHLCGFTSTFKYSFPLFSILPSPFPHFALRVARASPSDPVTFPTAPPSQYPQSTGILGSVYGSGGTPGRDPRPGSDGLYRNGTQPSLPQAGWGGYSGVPEL
jgi:hypothetical protein